jgi:hypothetical protein
MEYFKMKFVKTLTAASVIAFSSMAAAEQPLSMADMDGVSAGGFGIAEAIATALGAVTATATSAIGTSVSTEQVFPQLGVVNLIQSNALADSASASDGVALALATGVGQTNGNLLSDTVSTSETATNSGVGALPSSMAMSTNLSLASSMIRGISAQSQSGSTAAAVLSNDAGFGPFGGGN